jgi:hypothetical protein
MLVIVVPPAFVAGVACFCGCLPLSLSVSAIIARCRWYKFRRMTNEICLPIAAGAFTVLCAFDLIILPVPALVYLLSWCIMRIRFGKRKILQ